jgi:hypothetical protein
VFAGIPLDSKNALVTCALHAGVTVIVKRLKDPCISAPAHASESEEADVCD